MDRKAITLKVFRSLGSDVLEEYKSFGEHCK